MYVYMPHFLYLTTLCVCVCVCVCTYVQGIWIINVRSYLSCDSGKNRQGPFRPLSLAAFLCVILYISI